MKDHEDRETRNDPPAWSTARVIWMSVLTGIVSASLGFGASQMHSADALKERVIINSGKIEQMVSALGQEHTERMESDIQVRKEMEAREESMQRRMDGLSRHMDVLIEQNTQLIALIKTQYQTGKP